MLEPVTCIVGHILWRESHECLLGYCYGGHFRAGLWFEFGIWFSTMVKADLSNWVKHGSSHSFKALWSNDERKITTLLAYFHQLDAHSTYCAYLECNGDRILKEGCICLQHRRFPINLYEILAGVGLFLTVFRTIGVQVVPCAEVGEVPEAQIIYWILYCNPAHITAGIPRSKAGRGLGKMHESTA
jgi:hypothetical protein